MSGCDSSKKNIRKVNIYCPPPPIRKIDYTAQAYAEAMYPVWEELIDKIDADEED